nr:hypothetical protein [Bacillus thuringiensis]
MGYLQSKRKTDGITYHQRDESIAKSVIEVAPTKNVEGSLVEIRKYNSDDIKQLTDLMQDLGYPSSLDEMK